MFFIYKLLLVCIIYYLKVRKSFGEQMKLNSMDEVTSIHVPLQMPKSKSNDDTSVLYPYELINIPNESHVHVIEDDTDSVNHKINNFIHKRRNLYSKSKEERQKPTEFEIKFPEKGDPGLFAPLVNNPIFSKDVNLTAADLKFAYMSYKGKIIIIITILP